jgi:hypothetical protein
MYTPGNIIYFTPFYFSDGGSKPKYFIVLNTDTGCSLIACLPTRKDSVPNFIEKKHGCINDATINFNCYFIEKNRPITENGQSFPLDTYIYGERVDVFNRTNFESNYLVDGVDYKIIGKLIDTEFKDMINCFRNSRSTKRKIRRALGAKI